MNNWLSFTVVFGNKEYDSKKEISEYLRKWHNLLWYPDHEKIHWVEKWTYNFTQHSHDKESAFWIQDRKWIKKPENNKEPEYLSIVYEICG